MTIPQDIMASARDLIDNAAVEQFPDGTFPDKAYESVARAILAERQRCADVAYTAAEDAYYGPYERFADRIKAAILAGDAP